MNPRLLHCRLSLGVPAPASPTALYAPLTFLRLLDPLRLLQPHTNFPSFTHIHA